MDRQRRRILQEARHNAVVEALHREKSDRAYAENEITKHLAINDKNELDFTYDYYMNQILAADPLPEAAQIKGDIDRTHRDKSQGQDS